MRQIWKWILGGVGGLVILALLIVGGYAVYLLVQYERIPDGQMLTVEDSPAETLEAGQTYTALTWNVGFGAYSHDFSFFMDSGTMLDGTRVQGTGSRAESRTVVETNVGGAAKTLSDLQPDLILLQEVDEPSDRSHDVDMRQWLTDTFPEYGAVYASNFHSAYLFYPVLNPHGQVNSGILTLSAYAVDEAVRRSYPVDESFPTKFFDLDRCFSVERLPVANGRELILINSHMSAYDEGGVVRAAQMEMLCQVLSEEAGKGNYIIVGGDFNHALCGTEEAFASQQKVPEWVYPFDESLLPEGFSVVRAENLTEVATCRSTDLPYEKEVNYTTVLDGFIVSDNVKAVAENLDTDFLYSDHNPVLLTFTLE